MSSYLAYSYSSCLTKKEQDEIDEKVKNSQEEFSKGFVKGASFSLTAYSLYSISTSVAYAADTGGGTPPQTPGNTEVVKPASTSKPGFKPLPEAPKGAYVGGATAICGAALQTGDFYIGLACAFLLVIGGIVINRP